jgi:predicted dehydrogenase/threonine dehydrogenase-like Zn-dependent dehydrogenase
MKQVIRKGLRDIIVDEVPEPVAKAHHVLIRPVFSLISSGTETASIHQEAVVREVAENPSHLRKIWEVMKITDPVRTTHEILAKFNEYAALGYSGAGILVDKHPTVTDMDVGARVAYGGEGTGHAETIITGRNLVVPVPDAVPFEEACFTTLGSIALNSVRIAEVGLGDTVAVLGLGIVGQLVCQLVRASGGVALAIDLVESRVELARNLGASHAFVGGASLPEAVRGVTDGRGADCVIVAAASKSAVPCAQALSICKDRGRIVIVGAVDVRFPWEEMYKKEIRLFMSRAYGPGSYDERYEKGAQDYPIAYVRWTENRNMAEFLRLVSRGDVRLKPLITHEFSLDEAPRAYETIMDASTRSLAVLLRYPAPGSAESNAAARRKTVVPVAPTSAGASGLRVALIGASNIARWAHMPGIKKAPNVTLRAVCSTSGVRGKSYARRYGAAYCCTDFADILKDPEIDVVVITTRHQYHAEQALAALEAGKHVFVEKPMALTEDECRALHRAVRESGKRLSVGFNRRFAPSYRELKRFAARRSGPAVINCRINSPGMSGSFWGADPSIGGAILGEAVHFIDLMYWLLGSEPVGVSAFSLPTGAAEPIGENNLAAIFSFADASIANFTYCTVGSRASQGERVEVFVNGGAAVAENFKRSTVMGALSRTKSRLWPAKGYEMQMASFLSSLRSGEPPEVSERDGARATIGGLRMLESARTQTPCAIDLEAILQ